MVWFWNPWCDVGYRWGCCWLLTYFLLELNNWHTIFKSFATEMLNCSYRDEKSCKENLCNWVIVWRSMFLVFWSRGGCSLAVDVVGKRIMDVGTVRKLKDSEGWQCLNGCGCLFTKMPTLPLPALQSSLLLADVWRMCMTRILRWVPHYKTDDHCHHRLLIWYMSLHLVTMIARTRPICMSWGIASLLQLPV